MCLLLAGSNRQLAPRYERKTLFSNSQARNGSRRRDELLHDDDDDDDGTIFLAQSQSGFHWLVGWLLLFYTYHETG